MLGLKERRNPHIFNLESLTEAELKELKKLPPQSWVCRLPREEALEQLTHLQPEIAWCHCFKLAEDVYTVTPDQSRYFGKAQGLAKIGKMISSSIPYITKKQAVTELKVLDLACAEGVHSIEFAHAGAQAVLGLEGRQLYVDRSDFIAKCAGLNNVSFVKGDVRSISKESVGTFDLVLFLGILHHLQAEAFFPMLQKLHEVTEDTLVLYTHTSNPGCEVKFGHKLSDSVTTPEGYSGRLYREHPDNLSLEAKESRVRNSLDNTHSFWPDEQSLVDALNAAGFKHISRLLHPNPFGKSALEFRVLFVCRR